jgi:hypothetical protein
MNYAAADPVTSKSRLAYGQPRCPDAANRQQLVVARKSFGRIFGCIAMNHDKFLSKTPVLFLGTNYDIHLLI